MAIVVTSVRQQGTVDPPTPTTRITVDGVGGLLLDGEPLKGAGANFWVGALQTDGFLPGQYWQMNLDSAANVRYLMSWNPTVSEPQTATSYHGWGLKVFRLNVDEDSPGDPFTIGEPGDSMFDAVNNITANDGIAWIDRHWPTGTSGAPDKAIDMSHVPAANAWFDVNVKPVHDALPSAQRQLMAYEPWNEPSPDSSTTPQEWYAVNAAVADHIRNAGFEGIFVPCADQFGQDRLGVNDTYTSSVFYQNNNGLNLQTNYGPVVGDMHVYSLWDPSWVASSFYGPVDQQKFVDYFTRVPQDQNLPLFIGEHGGPAPPSMRVAPEPGWSVNIDSAQAIADFGSQLKIGLWLECTNKVFPIAWHGSRLSSRLTWSTGLIPNTGATDDGWMGRVAGTNSTDVQPTLSSYPHNLHPTGEITWQWSRAAHQNIPVDHQRFTNLWNSYVNDSLVTWH